jgi:GNAT superfamily N-acetyltransferase
MMSDLTIRVMKTPSEREIFITFPWKVYKDNPYWVPPLINERKHFLDPEKNPFFEHAEAEYFMAFRGGEPVGTIAAFTNSVYNEFQDVNVGYFGFFEVFDDREAAHALLKAAEDWARKAGHDAIMGPAQFSTNDEAFLLIDGFDDPPRALMTYNPPYYQGLIESAGFPKVMDVWAYSINIPDFLEQMPDKLERVVQKVKERGRFNIRPVRLKDWDREVERVKKIYHGSWERNWGFVPFTDAEFDQFTVNLKPILDPDLTLVVEVDGEAVGFSLSIPDLNQPLLKAYPRKGIPEPLTMLKLLWYWKVRKQISWLRVVALGVLPEYRAKGVDAMMYLETAKRAAPKGYKWAEMSWILENNMMMNRSIQMLGGEVYKTYRMYEKKL